MPLNNTRRNRHRSVPCPYCFKRPRSDNLLRHLRLHERQEKYGYTIRKGLSEPFIVWKCPRCLDTMTYKKKKTHTRTCTVLYENILYEMQSKGIIPEHITPGSTAEKTVAPASEDSEITFRKIPAVSPFPLFEAKS